MLSRCFYLNQEMTVINLIVILNKESSIVIDKENTASYSTLTYTLIKMSFLFKTNKMLDI